MKQVLFITITSLFFTSLKAQDTSEMETDRPDQTETPIITARRYFQVEIGFTKESQGGKNYQLSVPTALLKYGLSKRAELRLEMNYHFQYIQLVPKPVSINGFAPVEIGTKIALLQEKGACPQTSFIGHIGLGFLSKDEFKPARQVASFRFALQNTLSKTVALGYNLGLQWEGENDSPQFTYTFAPGFDLSEHWYVYVEAFGFIGKKDFQHHNIDGGIAYRINQNMKVDFSGGCGLSKVSDPGYVAVGFSFRLPLGKP